MKTVALFGGSFDPPHIAHVAIVRALENFRDIQKVVVMPTFLNPFKTSSYAPSSIRIMWLKKIFDNFKYVEVSHYEVDQEQKVSSIESVKHLLKDYDKVYLVIGADNLLTLDKWDRYKELKKLVTFIVATRDNIEIPQGFLKLIVNENISSTKLRDQVDLSKLPQICAKEIIEFYKEKSAK